MASFTVDTIVQVANDYALEHLRGAVGIAQQIRVDDGAAWVVFDGRRAAPGALWAAWARWAPFGSQGGSEAEFERLLGALGHFGLPGSSF